MFVCFKHTVQFGIYVSNATTYVYKVVCFKRAVQFGIYVSNRIALPSEVLFLESELVSKSLPGQVWDGPGSSPEGSGKVPGTSWRGL